MKQYKVRLFGKGILGEHLIPFEGEPTTDQVNEAVAFLINEGIMKLEIDIGFYSRNSWTLTYEEVKE
jgi:hypothetical protein